MENHNELLRNMSGFTTPTVIITGCSYNYIVQIVIHGDLNADTTSLQYMINRGSTNDRATEVHPKGEAWQHAPTTR